MMYAQSEFGSFDPRFLGATIRFENLRTWNIYQEWSARSDGRVSLDGLSPDERFECLSVVSVAAHEIRHFHDFLLSPASAHVFRLRVKALLNAFQVLGHLANREGNFVPVPMALWCQWSDVKRKTVIAQLKNSQDGVPWHPVLAPPRQDTSQSEHPEELSAEKDPLVPLILETARNLERIREFMENTSLTSPEATFRPAQVYELSALLVQAQEIWNVYGGAEVTEFLNYVTAGRNIYADVLRLTAGLWHKRGELFDTDGAAAVATWSLLGSYEVDGWSACPSERYARLWGMLRQDSLPTELIHLDRDDIFTLFDQWSARTGLSKVADGLAYGTRLLDRLAEDVAEIVRAGDGLWSGELGETLLRVVEGVVAAKKAVTASFLADPASYIRPHIYLKSLTSRPTAVLRVVFDGCGLATSDDAIEKEGWDVRFAHRTLDEKPVVVSYTQKLGFSNIDLFAENDVMELFAMFQMSEVLFERTVSPDPDLPRVRHALSQISGLRFRNISV